MASPSSPIDAVPIDTVSIVPVPLAEAAALPAAAGSLKPKRLSPGSIQSLDRSSQQGQIRSQGQTMESTVASNSTRGKSVRGKLVKDKSAIGRLALGQTALGKWTALMLLLLLGSLAETCLGPAVLAQTSPAAAMEAIPETAEEALEAIASPPEAPTAQDAPAASSAAQPPIVIILEPNSAAEPATAPASVTLPPAVGMPQAKDAPPLSETAPAASSDEETANQRVYFANNQVSFVPPMGFTPMSQTEITEKFPGSMPPQFAFANDARDVSVGVSVSEIPLAPEQLPEVKAFLENFLETSVPGFEWLEHDFVNLGGQDWIKLEFLSQADQQRIHNDMYITSLQGNLFGFNFNADTEKDPDLRPLLRASRDSILINSIIAAE